MKKQSLWMLAAILTLCSCSVFFSACQSGKGSSTEPSLVAGTLDGPLGADSVPAPVLDALVKAARYHQYEIMSDSASSITVEAISEAGETSTQGYGIVVVKNATSTTFPQLRNVRQNKAAYDKEQDILWLTCSVMEGTGISVERLYQIRFGEDDKAYIAHTVEPYDLQQQLIQRLGYTILDQNITFWDGTRELTTAANTVEDMGGFDAEQPIWIGEQIAYDLSGSAPRLLVTPGVKFTTGLVLTYDDMPTLTAPLTLADDGTVSLGEIEPQVP